MKEWNPVEFAVGDFVVFGDGEVPYRVAAVIDTGRITTYDLVGEIRRYQGVPHSRLKLAPKD